MNTVVLVAGATGITGSYIAAHLAEQASVSVLKMSRSGPGHLHADLLRPEHLAGLVSQLAPVTHLFYTAFAGNGAASWASLTETNTRMFANLLDAVLEFSPGLRRVVLMQGQKYYGTHLGPFSTPARETDPRHAGENFYFTQEDLLAQRWRLQANGRSTDPMADASAVGWDYVCLRPHIVCGHNMVAPQNPIAVLSQYALLMKRGGFPLHYPGPQAAYDRLYQATDAQFLGEAAHWALNQEGIGGEAFNIINGDFFRWSQIWPLMAQVFEMPLGEIVEQDLTQTMPVLASKHLPGAPAPDWAFANYLLSRTYDVMACTLKGRRFGFNNFRDSHVSLTNLLTEARSALIRY